MSWKEYIAHAALAVAQAVLARAVVRWIEWEIAKMKTPECLKTTDYLTVNEAAALLGLPPIHVVRTYERGFMPPAKRFGRMRMIPAGDLDKLREAAKEAGYKPKK